MMLKIINYIIFRNLFYFYKLNEIVFNFVTEHKYQRIN